MGPEDVSKDLAPLFEAIISHLPGPEVDPEAPLQFQANNIDYDEYVGRLAIGRVVAGTINAGGTYALYRADGSRETCKVAHLYGWRGLKRAELSSADAGDVVMVAGLEDIEIGETITDPENPRPLPGIRIDEPTVRDDIFGQ